MGLIHLQDERLDPGDMYARQPLSTNSASWAGQSQMCPGTAAVAGRVPEGPHENSPAP